MPVLSAIHDLWRHTWGEPSVRVAIVDGQVDLGDPRLTGARLTQPTQAQPVSSTGFAGWHATQVACLILGREMGLAPGCSGINLAVFESSKDSTILPCSQLDLARALTIAIQEEVHIINVSAGQFAPSGVAHPLLEQAIRECERRGILVVAAAGNEGCDCLHVPAASPTVLSVGAVDADGEPMAFSNWGEAYRDQGIVAPGPAGTSFAAAYVSGVAALLLSMQVKLGRKPTPLAVRDALRASALGCDAKPAADCRRLLLGRLNIPGAIDYLLESETAMSSIVESLASDTTPVIANMPAPAMETEPAVLPSACSCAGGAKSLVYALGQISYDLVSEARLDSLVQKMAGGTNIPLPQRMMAFDARQLLKHIQENPWDAAAVTWTLVLDGTPIYAIKPAGPFATEGYRLLAQFLREQLDEGVERVSIPGTMSGTTRLMMGQTVPVIVPDLRGMYSWTTKDLVASAVGAEPTAAATAAEREAHERRARGVRNLLDRMYHGLRNLGQLPQDRALNFAATNAFEIESMYESAIKENMDVDTINVVRSSVCRPGSDCWDVELYFFFPERQVQTVRKVYRFTVDVSDVVPVTVGTMREWFAR